MGQTLSPSYATPKGSVAMPGKTPEPWYRESKRAWFVCINGKQHRLGKHKEEAHRRFHLLMAGETPTHGKAGQQSAGRGGGGFFLQVKASGERFNHKHILCKDF
jgi:hypothetical protein